MSTILHNHHNSANSLFVSIALFTRCERGSIGQICLAAPLVKGPAVKGFAVIPGELRNALMLSMTPSSRRLLVQLLLRLVASNLLLLSCSRRDSDE